jgi:hypothetical protein
MPLKTRAIDASLTQKGFVREVRDHIYFWFRFEGRDCGVFTHISHGDREIGDPLIAKMAKQVKLSKRDFVQLVECPMSYGDYLARLREQGVLPPSP